jgi:putative transposase
VSLTAVRWSVSYPLSATHVLPLLAARHLAVSARTGLNWGQTFGSQLAKALPNYRRRLGRRWDVDEVVCLRGGQKRYLYRAVEQQGQVRDILLRDKRDRARAEAFCRRALRRTGGAPHPVGSDHHRPYRKAVVTPAPIPRPIRTGWHRARGETTTPIERSPVATRDR